MNLKERLKIFIEYNQLSTREFERECSLNRGNISNMTGAIGSDKLTKIIDRFPELNMYWLLTGKGEMIKLSESNPLAKEYTVRGKELFDAIQTQSAKALDSMIVAGKLFTKDTVKAKDEIIKLQEEKISQLKEKIAELEKTISLISKK